MKHKWICWGVDVVPGLDWFTEEAQERQAEIYASFHPDEAETEENKKQDNK